MRTSSCYGSFISCIIVSWMCWFLFCFKDCPTSLSSFFQKLKEVRVSLRSGAKWKSTKWLFEITELGWYSGSADCDSLNTGMEPCGFQSLVVLVFLSAASKQSSCQSHDTQTQNCGHACHHRHLSCFLHLQGEETQRFYSFIINN